MRSRSGRFDFCHWYILVAQGHSLHEKLGPIGFCRRETHHFVNAPAEVTSSVRALWYAVAMAESGDSEVALRISRSKIAGLRADQYYWLHVARFFARNPSSVLEMSDLIDFLNAQYEECGDYSLDGRTLASVRRRMHEWHHALHAGAVVCGRSWKGHPLADAQYETLGPNGPAIWRFHQIKTDAALFREGERMHHCVVSYHPLNDESVARHLDREPRGCGCPARARVPKAARFPSRSDKDRDWQSRGSLRLD
jgi:hypothetical protein